MKPLKHLTISASAGSGKTYQLTNRYIQILAREVPPERIVALTFTRKAAGEIFDRIIERIARAACSPDTRSELSAFLEHDLSEEQTTIMLRSLIQSMPMLRVGTLDSFMSQIVRLFAYELGIQGGFEIIDGPTKALEEQRALKSVLSHSLSEKEKRAFLESFKQATYGAQENSVVSTITRFIENYHITYLDAPNGAIWGNPAAIWPDGCHWFENVADFATFRQTLNKLRSQIEQIPAAIQKPWLRMLDDFSQFDHHKLPTGKIIENLITNSLDLKAGELSITYNKKPHILPSDVAKQAYTLIQYAVSTILITRLHRTQGMFRVLDRYEQSYNTLLRKAGKLAFNDILQVLNGRSSGTDAHRLTQVPNTPEALYIDYRLDGRFDHWMIDEFQDTSNAQWSILSNLIDETMQYDDGSRSFFYVGDVKQAIYGWRGGDSRLFDRIYNHYRNLITRESLPTSYRSAAPIIDAVNHVFTNMPVTDTGLTADVVDRWNTNWDIHATARKDLAGHCAYYQIPKVSKDDDLQNRFALAGAIVDELLDATHPPSVALLVRNGSTGIALTDALRSQGIPAVWEGDSTVVDNPVTAALLSLLKLAQHPGDTLALEHIRMTPLQTCINTCNLNPVTLPLDLLNDLHHHGFRYTLSKWIDLITEHTPPLSSFTNDRLNTLLQCAMEYDEQNNPDVLQFIRYVTDTKSKSVLSGQVRVLTIHKSKGLGFDAVILPELQGAQQGITKLRSIGITTRVNNTSEGSEPQWVLDMPDSKITDADPILSAHKTRLQQDKTYEELCAIYVAMTRAKQGLYMITTAPGPRDTAYYASTLIHEQLQSHGQPEPATKSEVTCSCIYQTGDPDWHRNRDKSDKPDQARAVLNLTPNTHTNRLQRHIPSSEEGATLEANLLFARHGRKAADFGTAIHALFEEIEWYCEEHIPALIEKWNQASSFPPETRNMAIAQFKTALQAPDVQHALTQPAAHAEVWREKRFEIALESRWISGCFDRVTIEYNQQGTPVRATILDYKSNRIKTPEDLEHAKAIYQSQLALYREVLAKLLAIPESSIQTQLLFTHTAQVIDIPLP